MKDVCEAGIADVYLVKKWGLKFTLNAVLTVLKVDQASYSHTRELDIVLVPYRGELKGDD